MSCSNLMPCLDDDALDTVIRLQRAAGHLEICALVAVDQFGGQHILRLANHSGLPGAFEVSRSEDEAMRAAAADRG